jgi:hypothetical protein
MERIDAKKAHYTFINSIFTFYDEPPKEADETRAIRKTIEPWLAALVQSEHLSLLVGSGLTTALSFTAKAKAQTMVNQTFVKELDPLINTFAKDSAQKAGRV